MGELPYREKLQPFNIQPPGKLQTSTFGGLEIRDADLKAREKSPLAKKTLSDSRKDAKGRGN